MARPIRVDRDWEFEATQLRVLAKALALGGKRQMSKRADLLARDIAKLPTKKTKR